MSTAETKPRSGHEYSWKEMSLESHENTHSGTCVRRKGGSGGTGRAEPMVLGGAGGARPDTHVRCPVHCLWRTLAISVLLVQRAGSTMLDNLHRHTPRPSSPRQRETEILCVCVCVCAGGARPDAHVRCPVHRLRRRGAGLSFLFFL